MKEITVLYGGCFSPPGLHHRKIAEKMANCFGKVVVRPCGFRQDKQSSGAISRMDRKDLVGFNFSDLRNVEICYDDLDNDVFTPTWRLEEIYRRRGEVYHVIGPDLVEGGAKGESEIQREWKRGEYLWQNLNFVVIAPQNCPLATIDLPPKTTVIPIDPLDGRSKQIRKLIAEGQSFEHLMFKKVAKAIKDRRLYGYKE